MERLSYGLAEVKFADAAPGEFEGYASVFGVVDSHGDMIVPGAFSGTLARIKAEGRSLPMYMQHGAVLGGDPRPVGVWSALEEDGKGLRVKGRLVGLDTEAGRFNHALVKEGAMRGLSIGYRPVKADYGKKPGEPRRTLKEIKLIEVSIVDDPSNPLATVTDIKSIEDLASLSDAEDILREAGFSKAAAVAFVSRIKAMSARSDSDRGGLDELAASLRRAAAALKR